MEYQYPTTEVEIDGQKIQWPTSNISPDDIKMGLLMHFDCDCLDFLGDRYHIESIVDDDTYEIQLYCLGKKHPHYGTTTIQKEEILSKWYKTNETLEQWKIRIELKKKK